MAAIGSTYRFKADGNDGQQSSINQLKVIHQVIGTFSNIIISIDCWNFGNDVPRVLGCLRYGDNVILTTDESWYCVELSTVESAGNKSGFQIYG